MSFKAGFQSFCSRLDLNAASQLRIPAAMPPVSKPTTPLVVIIGSTGTGKSDLAVELALEYGGEVINADAMQMYRGLPVVTNQITEADQKGVPHHLISHIDLDEATWAVGDWKRETLKKIHEIRSQGKLPIVVGGTHYYINGLLFEDKLVTEASDDTTEFPILDETTQVILTKLREVDPVMADVWHPKDRRKIRRSLEIFLRTGKKASTIYAEQRRRKEEQKVTGLESPSESLGPWETLMFWVYSDPEVLKTRLDRRVDKMQNIGFMEEVQDMYEYLEAKKKAGVHIDLTRGIWQTIGFKEFQKYLDAANGSEPTDPTLLENLKLEALEEMKTGTRQYAKYQIRWINRKLLPLLQEEGPDAMSKVFVMDSTDAPAFATNVIAPAIDITKSFLDGASLPAPEDITPCAKQVLDVSEQPVKPRDIEPFSKTCELCHMTLVSQDQWDKHIKSRRHSRVAKNAKKRALAVVPGEEVRDVTVSEEVDLEAGVTNEIGLWTA